MIQNGLEQEKLPPITAHSTPPLELIEQCQEEMDLLPVQESDDVDQLPCGAGFRACTRSPVRTSHLREQQQQPQEEAVVPPSSSSKPATKPTLLRRRSEREKATTAQTGTGIVSSSTKTDKNQLKAKRRAEIYALNQILRQVQQEKMQKFINAQTSHSSGNNNNKSNDSGSSSIQPQMVMITSTVGV